MTHYIENIRFPRTRNDGQTIKRSVEKWTGLSDLSHYLVGSDSMTDLIARASYFITNLLGIDSCRIYLLGEDGRFDLPWQNTKDNLLSPSMRESDRLIILRSLFKRILASEPNPRPTSTQQHLSTTERKALSLEENDNHWILPLMVDSNPIGVLVMSNSSGGMENPFSTDAYYIVDLVADQLANALHRNHLNERLVNLSIETVLALSKTLETRDTYSGSHSKRMANLSEKIANQYGFSIRETRELCWTALLHDIGKIGVEDQILHKPGPLTTQEWEIMRTHPEIGAQMIRGLSGMDKIASLILCHHEWVDGSGYPHGIAGAKIPLGARIIAVVDSYSAMTEGRIYRGKKSHDEAITELKRYSGKRYDPEVVRMFIRLFDCQEMI
jgi:putative nucleotidyltransferase with HDIG domain